jgi:murein DD-endopeptidase MepM/ murein hydrolase activator NlpD
MASKFDLGDVGQSGTATGPHAHLYVKDRATGQYLDPRTIRSPLLGLRVGQQEIPAFVKDASGKIVVNPQSGITITSGFGARVAPTAGASSFHQGEDLALPAATKLSYQGTGTYTPKPGSSGFGNLGTFVTGDNKYELGFGHMSRLGQPASIVSATGSTTSSQSPTYEQSQQRTNDILEAFMKGTQYQAATQPQARTKTASESLKDQLLASLMGGGANMLQGVTDTSGLPQEYINAIWG